MNALTISVGYDDLLALTLPRMAAVFGRVCVVTDPHDHATVLLAESRDNVFAHQTDAFYRHGATFNKGAALEEGFALLGRDGWLCVIDADVVLPAGADFSGCEPGFLYTARRRMCDNPREWNSSGDWSQFAIGPDREWAGYLQAFYSEDAVLFDRPWYDQTWRHAGGCDSSFQSRWEASKRRLLPFEVLHLGPHSLNWWGRTTPRLDGTPLPDNRNASRNMREMYRQRRCTKCYDWEKIHPICSTQ